MPHTGVVSFAHMQSHRGAAALSFDHDFATAGFQTAGRGIRPRLAQAGPFAVSLLRPWHTSTR